MISRVRYSGVWWKEKSAMFGGKMRSGGNEEGCWKPQALLVDLQCGRKAAGGGSGSGELRGWMCEGGRWELGGGIGEGGLY